MSVSAFERYSIIWVFHIETTVIAMRSIVSTVNIATTTAAKTRSLTKFTLPKGVATSSFMSFEINFNKDQKL